MSIQDAPEPYRPRGIEIDVPEQWEQHRPGGQILLAARPATWPDDGLSPLLSVTHLRLESDIDLTAYVDVHLELAALTLTPHLVHHAVSQRPYPHLDVTLATEQGGEDVTITQRHLLDERGRIAVVASVICPTSEWARLGETLISCVRSIRHADRGSPEPNRPSC